MRLLMDRFPDNIRLYVAEYEGTPHAGVCIYDTGLVAHAQYIATTPSVANSTSSRHSSIGL